MDPALSRALDSPSWRARALPISNRLGIACQWSLRPRQACFSRLEKARTGQADQMGGARRIERHPFDLRDRRDRSQREVPRVITKTHLHALRMSTPSLFGLSLLQSGAPGRSQLGKNDSFPPRYRRLMGLYLSRINF